jgi:hypothetical protein
MQTNSYYIRIAFICLLATALMPACDKDDAEAPVRLFRPVLKDNMVSEGNWIEVNWQDIKGAKSYVIAISADTFKTILQTAAVDTNAHLFEGLEYDKLYQLQVKAIAEDTAYNSKWSILGALKTAKFPTILATPVDADLTDKTVKVKWTNSGATVTNLKVLLAADNSLVKEVALDASDVTNQFKVVTGLTAKTKYIISIYSGTAVRGTESYTTKEPSLYAVILKPGDDLVAAVTNAVNGDVIGLEPGVYNCVDPTSSYVNLILSQKAITIQSISNDPSNTKVNYREFTLKGTGAGITLKGIEFDGASANATASQALYFVNLVGLGSDGEAATFKNIIAENCVIRNFGNCLLRANRGTSNNSHKIGTMRFNNCIIKDCPILNAYTFFTLEKLEFEKLELTNSTIANIGRGFVGWSTNITIGTPPVILVDQCTINNFGRDARNNFFIDANGNAVVITIKNSIIANTPYAGQTVGASLVRATAAVTSTLSYTNTFKLNNGASPAVAVTWPGVITTQNNKTVDLGWDGTTTSFALPAGSELRTSNSSGGPVGDPRWAQ